MIRTKSILSKFIRMGEYVSSTHGKSQAEPDILKRDADTRTDRELFLFGRVANCMDKYS